MIRMVSLPEIDIEILVNPNGSIKLDEKGRTVYEIKELNLRWFNLYAVQTVYAHSETSSDKPVSVVVLNNGSFLTRGTPEEVSKNLNNMSFMIYSDDLPMIQPPAKIIEAR